MPGRREQSLYLRSDQSSKTFDTDEYCYAAARINEPSCTKDSQEEGNGPLSPNQTGLEPASGYKGTELTGCFTKRTKTDIPVAKQSLRGRVCGSAGGK